MIENLPVKLVSCKSVAESTYEAVFEYDQNLFSFNAGQYIKIIIPKLEFEDKRGNSRDFSIASSPNIKGSFSIVFRNTGSGFKRTLIEAKKGFTVEITGPQGIFSLEQMEGKSAVFIAGGIGITPFLSIIRFATEQKPPLKIILLYANSNKESAICLPELKKLEKENPNFKMVILFTHITKEVIKQQIEDITDKYFYLAGPPEMTASAAKELSILGIEDKKISIEEFSGYAKSLPVSDDASKAKTGARLDALLDSLEKIAIVSATDIKGNITYVNDKFIEISKYSKDELMGQNHRMIKSGYHDEAFYKNLWDTILAGKIWHGEIKNKAKDDTFYWVDSSISPTFDEKGKIMGYVAVRFPITEIKNMEEKLRESEHRLSLNIQNAPMGIIEWDKDFQVVGWNPAAEKIFGYSKAEAMGKHASFIIPDEFKPQVDQIWSQLISGGANQSTNGNITKDGQAIICDWHNAPLTTSDGKVFGVVSMVLDITQAKKAEDAIKESQLMLQNIIDLLPIRIFWKDINLKYLGSNKAFALDAGKKSPAELIGKDDFEMAWKEQADLYRADDMKVIKSGISKLDYEEPQTTSTGDKIWLNTNKVPLKNSLGKITGVLGTYIDITERKKAEENLKSKNEELEKMNQLMIGRELKMIELKKELEKLKGEKS